MHSEIYSVVAEKMEPKYWLFFIDFTSVPNPLKYKLSNSIRKNKKSNSCKVSILYPLE